MAQEDPGVGEGSRDTCIVGSAVLVKPLRDQVGETTALVDFSCEAQLPSPYYDPSTDGTKISTSRVTTENYVSYSDGTESYDYAYYETYRRYYITFKDLVYEWEFFPDGDTQTTASGTTTIRGMEKKGFYDVYGKVKVTCTKVKQEQRNQKRYADHYYTTWEGEGEDRKLVRYHNGGDDPYRYTGQTGWTNYGSPVETTPSGEKIQETNHLQYVWTRPGKFEGYDSCAYNEIIEYKITVSVVNSWIEHAKAMNHWFTQSDQNPSLDGCSAVAKAIIRASWYNNCARVCNLFTEATGISVGQVSGGATGDKIVASRFNGPAGLAKGITKEGEPEQS